MGRDLAVGIALTTDPERARGKLARFCRGLAEASGLTVHAHGMFHYHHLSTALDEGKLDLVWLPPLLALRATGKGSIVPIALPVRHGVSTYSTALFSRPDSSIRGIEDLKGVRAAWVDPHSASGYLVIRALLRSRGVDLAAAFAKNVFLGAHDAVVKVVLAGQADVGATFAYLDKAQRQAWGLEHAAYGISCDFKLADGQIYPGYPDERVKMYPEAVNARMRHERNYAADLTAILKKAALPVVIDTTQAAATTEKAPSQEVAASV